MSTLTTHQGTSGTAQGLARRLVLTAVGGDPVEHITLETVPDPIPGEGEIAVAIEAAPINGADLLFAAGWFGVQPSLPAALGGEGAGRVVAAGPGVDPGLIGRRVAVLPTFRYGTWATRIVIPEKNAVAVPESVDPRQAAMLSVNPAAAYALLNDFVTLRAGDWVGINMANSAVAQAFIPLARRAGVRTLAIVRRASAVDAVRRLGADRVEIDGDDLAARVSAVLGSAKLRALYEGTGDPEQVARLAGAIEDGGALVSFAAATGKSPALPLGDLIYRGISLRGLYILRWIAETPRARLEQVYDELAGLVAEGTLGAIVEATYPLEEYATALRHATREQREGKVLFTPGAAQ